MRLTRVDEDGTILCIRCVDEECNGNCLICEHDIEAMSKLAEYEDLEEQGLLLREEDVLKFYYCESKDKYLVGKRLDTLYYAEIGKTGLCFEMSRYLPWGKHVVDPNSAWKEYTYPSEPKEIPFFEWLQGYMKQQALERMEKENG